MIYQDDIFMIKRYKNGYVLIRKNRPYKYHTHTKQRKVAMDIICLYRKQLMPYSPYLKKSMERLLDDDEKENFRISKKPNPYVNRK